MNLPSLPMIILIFTIFRDNFPIIFNKDISVKLKFFETDIYLYCFERGNDLVVALSPEMKDIFSDINLPRQVDTADDMEDYENYFIKVLADLQPKISANVMPRLDSIEATIYGYKHLADVDKASLFLAIREMDIFFLGLPVQTSSQKRKGKSKFKSRRTDEEKD